MNRKTIVIGLTLLVFVGTVNAWSIVQPAPVGESDVNVKQLDSDTLSDYVKLSGDTMNGYLNMSNNNIYGLLSGQCEVSSLVAQGYWENGSVSCVTLSNPAETLSETLAAGNSADSYSINMSGNNITGLRWINPSSDWKTAGSIDQEITGPPRVLDTVIDSNFLDGSADIHVSGDYAYLTSTFSEALTVLDVSDPSNIRVVGNVTSTADLNNAYGVHVAGDYAYVAARDSNALTVVDVSDPTAPNIAGTVSNTTYLDGPFNVYVSGGYAYLGALDSDSLGIVDVSDPAAPSVVGGVNHSTKMNTTFGVYVRGDYAYTASKDSNSLTVIDVSDPSSPSIVGSVSSGTMDGPQDVKVSGGHAYVTARESHSLTAVDISRPDRPEVEGSVNLSGSVGVNGGARLFDIAGDYTYIGGGPSDTFNVVDISDPANPAVVTNFTMTDAHGVYVTGSHVYVTRFNGDGLTALSLTGMKAPAADIGNLEVGALHIDQDLVIDQNLEVKGGLNVGSRGIKSDGRVAAESLEVTGTKNFVQSVNETHSVVYTSSESGEAVVEWSKTVNVSEGENFVQFPRHYRYVLSDKEDYHVFIQPWSFVDLEVVEKRQDGILLESTGAAVADVHVRGARKGFEDTQPLRKR